MNVESHDSGTLLVVGLGPGDPGLLTPDAASAIDRAEVVVGYRGYLELVAPRLAGKTIVGRELGEEVERAELALRLAEEGKTVALVSSGDAGVYGMGGLVWELAARQNTPAEVVIVPGITAACSAAARLGAPLAHDWACVSLSDLLTPWDVIARRIEAAARGDFVLVLYNPASRTRTWQLPACARILLEHRDPATPVGLVENAYRPSERTEVITLGALVSTPVSMFTTVIVGSSRTFVSNGRMITPRIYEAKAGAEPSGTLGLVEKGDRHRAASPIVPACSAEQPGASPLFRQSPPGSAPGESIFAESLAIIDREMGPQPSNPEERAVVRRVIHSSADFDYVQSMRFGAGAIGAAVAAFRGSAAVLADVEMLRAGIRRDLAEPLGVSAVCGLNEPESLLLAGSMNLTRSAAGLRRAAERLGDSAVIAIGNAPTALEETVRLIEQEGWRPACVVGIPVGFVGVEEAKRRLVEQDRVPYITSLGRKGGTAVTAAVVNALLELAGGTASG